jgi:hypothetical protein
MRLQNLLKRKRLGSLLETQEDLQTKANTKEKLKSVPVLLQRKISLNFLNLFLFS